MKRIVLLSALLLVALLPQAQNKTIPTLRAVSDTSKLLRRTPLALPKRPAVGHYTLVSS